MRIHLDRSCGRWQNEKRLADFQEKMKKNQGAATLKVDRMIAKYGKGTNNPYEGKDPALLKLAPNRKDAECYL